MNSITTKPPANFYIPDMRTPGYNNDGAEALEIRTIKWLHANRKHQLETPHKCRQFMIVWIQKGEMRHAVDAVMHNTAESLYCITPGHVHQIFAAGDTEGYIIYFNAEYIEGMNAGNLLFEINIFRPFPVNVLEKTDKNDSNIESIFRSLLNEYNNYSLLRGEILSGYMKLLFACLTYQPVNITQSAVTGYCMIKRFFILLYRNYRTKKQVTDYASDMAITPSYLNQLIKKATGNPASYHIRERIISEAKRQVSQNGLNLKETAYYLGFDDLSHFSKYFKNATGTNFSEFKKTLSKSVFLQPGI